MKKPLRCVAISDTHGKYKSIEIPDGDVLIHAGDILSSGRNLTEVEVFNEWLGGLPHKHKIIIAGNHDMVFEHLAKEAEALITNAIYLRDSSTIIDGWQFYGAPWQPWFHSWAFNLKTAEQLKEKWDLIAENTDVLITHGPAHKILDKTWDGSHAGCAELLQAIARIKPKYHVFGHIHEGYGTFENEGCTHINASIMTQYYRPDNAPIVFELGE